MIINEKLIIPGLDCERTCSIFLPPGYDSSTDRRYPVLYMHDGQNLFVERGREQWEVDVALSMPGAPDLIVVGIHHGGNERLNELNPWFLEEHQFGGKGNEYLEFIVQVLKPFIDERYRTIRGRLHTAMAGSSLGGYMSIYASIKYPEVFGKVLAMSNALWHDQGRLLEMIKTNRLNDPLKIYMDTGEKESDNPDFNVQTVADHYELKNQLLHHGVKNDLLKFVLDSEGVHNEIHWRKRFPSAIKWLFGNNEIFLS
ncbi:alpha/beta hydrolase [Falsibacillus albus]|nr:alpha/beta hydrolase-fold protein [Falsibacillus albus]